MTGQMHNEQIQSQWARVRGKLRAEMGETAYRNWLKKLTLLQIRGQEVELAVPTRFVRDWIVSHYQDRLRTLWQAENPTLKAVEVIVDSNCLNGPAETKAAGRVGEMESAPVEIARKELGRGLAGKFRRRAPRSPPDLRRIRGGQIQRTGLCRRLSRGGVQRPCRSIRCSSMAASGWARPI